MKIKINQQFEINLKVRDIKNLNASKAATIELLYKIAKMLNASRNEFLNRNESELAEEAQEMADNMNKAIQDNYKD